MKSSGRRATGALRTEGGASGDTFGPIRETKISYLGAFAVGAARRGSTGPDDIRVGVFFPTPDQERAQFLRQFLGHPAFHSNLPANRRHYLST